MVGIRFSKCLGLNAADAPGDLVFDGKSGAWESPGLVNVRVDAGRLRSREGFTRVDALPWRDAYTSPDGRVFAVVDGVLSQILSGPVAAPLVLLATPGRVSWAALDDLVFWSNGVEKGLIQDGEAVEWGGKVFPDELTASWYVDPPAGEILEGFAGRVWIGTAKTLVFTEGAGFHHFWMQAESNFDLPWDVTLLRGVADGLYVGTAGGTFFLEGTDPSAMKPRLVDSSPAVLGTDLAVTASDLGKFDPTDAVLWASRKGICLGLPGGNVVKLTHSKAEMDVPARVGMSFQTDRRFITLLRP